jgi:hypothetical protein
MGSHDDLAALWRWFVAEEASGYSPLYTAIVEAAADDEDLLALVASAPESSQYPLLLLAAVHDLVLGGELPDLASSYEGHGPVEAAPAAFRTAVLDHRDHVLEVLRTRTVQTNECGRSSPLALGLAAVAATVGEPEALLDAGASAGLNLLYDRYRLEVGDAGVWGDPSSPVTCRCAVHGTAPFPLEPIDVPVRVGLDRAPIDLSDPGSARWLLACTWPDTGRLDRTRAAIDVAASSPPDVRTGDVVEDLGPLLDGLGGAGPVCVVTSWALGYLDAAQRGRFVEVLTRAGARRKVAWLSMENRGTVPAIEPTTSPTVTFTAGPSLMGLTTFGAQGVDDQRALAHVHPHGAALEWLGR